MKTNDAMRQGRVSLYDMRAGDSASPVRSHGPCPKVRTWAMYRCDSYPLARAAATSGADERAELVGTGVAAAGPGAEPPGRATPGQARFVRAPAAAQPSTPAAASPTCGQRQRIDAAQVLPRSSSEGGLARCCRPREDAVARNQHHVMKQHKRAPALRPAHCPARSAARSGTVAPSKRRPLAQTADRSLASGTSAITHTAGAWTTRIASGRARRTIRCSGSSENGLPEAGPRVIDDRQPLHRGLRPWTWQSALPQDLAGRGRTLKVAVVVGDPAARMQTMTVVDKLCAETSFGRAHADTVTRSTMPTIRGTNRTWLPIFRS